MKFPLLSKPGFVFQWEARASLGLFWPSTIMLTALLSDHALSLMGYDSTSSLTVPSSNTTLSRVARFPPDPNRSSVESTSKTRASAGSEVYGSTTIRVLVSINATIRREGVDLVTVIPSWAVWLASRVDTHCSI